MTEPLRWIWNSPTWPKLRYDQDHLIEPLSRTRDMAGRLRGKADAIGEDELTLIEGDVWAGNAVATSAIEGEVLDMAAVRLSVASRLGATPALSAGTFRTQGDPMRIVSGPAGKEIVQYVAPPSAAVRAEMRSFLDWFNGTQDSAAIDGILRAGIAHLWFESIHPFADGNGRIGRAIIDMAISQDMRSASRLHGISMELQRRQTDYYSALNHARRGTGDATEWLVWFAGSFWESCRTSIAIIDEPLVRAKFWNQHRNVELNARQRKALNRMLAAGWKVRGRHDTTKVHRVDQSQIHYGQPRLGRSGRQAVAGTGRRGPFHLLQFDDSRLGLGAQETELTRRLPNRLRRVGGSAPGAS
jgi:Fic family protein